MITGPRRSGRTTALMLAAVALADDGPVNFVVWHDLSIQDARKLLYKHFDSAETRMDNINIISWHDLRNHEGKPCIFDHYVTETIALRIANT